jgi:L-lactate utilization protein LutC
MLNNAAKGAKTSAIDTSRFSLSVPKDGDYKKALNTSKANLEYQRTRLLNLELCSKFGNNHWRIHTNQMEVMISSVKRKAEEVKDESNKVNRSRQQDQTHAQKTLESLNHKAIEVTRGSVRMANAYIEEQLSK